MAYNITNRTDLPVNIDELRMIIEPHQSATVHEVTSHIIELKGIGVLQVRRVTETATVISEDGVAPRRRSKSTD